MNKSSEPPVSLTRIAMTIGAITAGLMLILSAIPGLQILSWGAFVGGIYYSMIRFRKETGGFISYSKALAMGVQTAFFASLIMAFIYYMTAQTDPLTINAYLEAIEKMLQSYNLPSGTAESMMQQMREVVTPIFLAIVAILTYSMTGCLIALICALFVRNNHIPNQSLNS